MLSGCLLERPEGKRSVDISLEEVNRTTTHPEASIPVVVTCGCTGERLEITGPKKGCDRGSAVHAPCTSPAGRVLSCLTWPPPCGGRCHGRGACTGDELQPVQQASIDQGALQCGGFLHAGGSSCRQFGAVRPGRSGRREFIVGQHLPCSDYPNIISAIVDSSRRRRPMRPFELTAPNGRRRRASLPRSFWPAGTQGHQPRRPDETQPS